MINDIEEKRRCRNPLFSHVLFPVYAAALLWLGLYLRDVRVRQFIRSVVNNH